MAQPRPTGDSITASAEWKAWVIRRLGELGWSRSDLARRLKYPGTSKAISSAAITMLLGPEGEPLKASRTRLIPLIEAALGGSPPTDPATLSDEQALVLGHWHDIDPDLRALIVARCRQARDRRRG